MKNVENWVLYKFSLNTFLIKSTGGNIIVNKNVQPLIDGISMVVTFFPSQLLKKFLWQKRSKYFSLQNKTKKFLIRPIGAEISKFTPFLRWSPTHREILLELCEFGHLLWPSTHPQKIGLSVRFAIFRYYFIVLWKKNIIIQLFCVKCFLQSDAKYSAKY